MARGLPLYNEYNRPGIVVTRVLSLQYEYNKRGIVGYTVVPLLYKYNSPGNAVNRGPCNKNIIG